MNAWMAWGAEVERGLDRGLIRRRGEDAGVAAAGYAEMGNDEEERSEEDQREEPRFHGGECEEVEGGVARAECSTSFPVFCNVSPHCVEQKATIVW